MTRKILSSVICLLLVASTVFTVACAGDGKTTSGNNTNNVDSNNTNPSGASDYEINPDTTKLKFGTNDEPITLTFAYSESGETEENFTLRSIAPDYDDEEGDSADSVDAALIKRNSIIENQYGIAIDAYKASDSIQGLQGAIQSQMVGQDPDIDVVVGYQYYDIGMATQGWLANLATLKDEDNNPINYIDYKNKAYWGNAYIDALSYKDIVYWVTGDLALRYIGGMYCTFVNARLYEQYLSSFGNIYDIVDRGEWTLEMAANMANLIWEDRNGDDTVDQGDVFGFGWEQNDCTDALAIGSEVQFSTKSSDNSSVSLTLYANKTVTFVRELEKLLHGKNSLNVGDQDSTIIMPLFESGNSAFVVNKIFKAERYLTKMDDDFYIVPVPKLNKDQANYATLIHDGCSIYGISYFSDAKAAAAATLEYMAYLSHKEVFSLYYDQALKNKYTTDETSARMIELIHKNIVTDFAVAWSQSINDIAHWFRTHNKETRFTADLKRYTPQQQTSLEKLLENLEANADLATDA